jgi:hypothetical protein
VENLAVICYSICMTKLEKIEQEIETLSQADVGKLADWLEEYKSDLWDRQIEADAKAGKLDKFIAEARQEIAEGKVSPH